MSDFFVDGIKKDLYSAGKGSVRPIFQEFLVEVLGVFLPGIIFTVFVTFWTYVAVTPLDSVYGQPVLSNPMVNAPYHSIFIVGVVFFAVSYVMGHFFFRQPPATPDFRSAFRLSWTRYKSVRRTRKEEGEKGGETGESGMPLPVAIPCIEELYTLIDTDEYTIRGKMRRLYLAVSKWIKAIKHGKTASGEASHMNKVCRHSPNGLCCKFKVHWHRCDAEKSVEFPYAHLREYLDTRNLRHLADLVPWGTSTGAGKQRSKIFLNVLKIRLESVAPGWCHSLIRNEAHVRLMSSSWFMVRTIRNYVMILASVVIALYAVGSGWRFGVHSLLPAEHFFDIWGNLIVFTGKSLFWVLGATWAERTIEKFLLYQRIREATQVLDMAFYAAVLHPEWNVLAGLYSAEPASIQEARNAVKASA